MWYLLFQCIIPSLFLSETGLRKSSQISVLRWSNISVAQLWGCLYCISPFFFTTGHAFELSCVCSSYALWVIPRKQLASFVAPGPSVWTNLTFAIVSSPSCERSPQTPFPFLKNATSWPLRSLASGFYISMTKHQVLNGFPY